MAGEAPRQSTEGGIQLFRIAGIRIIIDYSWFIIFLLVVVSLSVGYLPQEHPGESPLAYGVAGIAATLAFFLSILFHELAHSFVAMAYGISIPSITLFLFGGVSRLSEEAKDPATELKIAIVGPFSSFALALGFWLLDGGVAGAVHPLVGVVLRYLAFINVALGIFNLAPGFPLDGGRVLRAILWWRTGSLDRATRIVSDLGKGFAMMLIFLGALLIFRGALLGGIWLILIGMFLRGSAVQGYEQLALSRALESTTVGDVMLERPVTLSPDMKLSRAVSEFFLRHGYRGFPVIDGEKPVGILSVKEIAGVPEAALARLTVAEAMRPIDESNTISRGASLLQALEKMSPESVGRLVILEDGRLAGMITKTGLVRLLEIRRILGSQPWRNS